MSTYELRPVYATAQSFYGKAKVECRENSTTLISYTTKVARVKDDKFELLNIDDHSHTTRRHVREFAEQQGYLNECNELYRLHSKELAKQRAKEKREYERARQ